MKEVYTFFKGYYKNMHLKMFIYVCFSFFSKLTMLLIPYTIKRIIDQIQLGNINIFFENVFLLVVLSVLFQICISIRYYMGNCIEIEILNKIRYNLFNKINYIPHNQLKNKTMGYFIQRVFDDCEQIKPLIISIYADVLINILFIISILVIMFRLNIIVSLIILTLIPLFILITKFFIPKIELLNKQILTQNEVLKTIFEESLNGNFDVRVNNGYDYIKNKFYNSLNQYMSLKYKDAKYNMTYNYVFVSGLMNLATILVYSIGGYLVLKNQLTIGALTAFSLYFSRLWDPVEYFMALPKDFKIRKISLVRILDVLNIKNEDYICQNSLSELESIKINDLCLNFENRTIFDKLNFEIKKGDKIGIKGDNGSGKSTFSKILIKMLNDYSGDVYYNELNYMKINSNDLRKKIVLIPSDIFIFNGTIKDNISLNRILNLDLDQYLDSMEFFGVFKKNKKDINSVLINNGKDLSGGEKKIIQILRGALFDGDLFILDEPLNFIDKDNKKLLIDFIKEIFKDKTLVIISHDEEIFECCDKIYSINNKNLKLQEKIEL